mmetsp:Transcript_2716/g.8539  ORF Transcript_2716/g.8539 Transcript_2716/m.8539 type:complete len:229 (-) Transcript_2716:799-1485(-)
MILSVVLAATASEALVASWPRSGRGALLASPTSAEDAVMLTEAQLAAKKASLEFRETKYFFGRVEVFMGERYKPLSEVFEPTLKDDTTAVSSVVVAAPFGMVIEESEAYPGRVQVLELVEGGNAAAAGVQVGDILRGTTAMALNVQRASEEDAAFSVGLSEGKKQCAFLNVDRQPFENIMSALQSNALANGGPGEACLVFERRVKLPDASDPQEAALDDDGGAAAAPA